MGHSHRQALVTVSDVNVHGCFTLPLLRVSFALAVSPFSHDPDHKTTHRSTGPNDYKYQSEQSKRCGQGQRRTHQYSIQCELATRSHDEYSRAEGNHRRERSEHDSLQHKS